MKCLKGFLLYLECNQPDFQAGEATETPRTIIIGRGSVSNRQKEKSL